MEADQDILGKTMFILLLLVPVVYSMYITEFWKLPSLILDLLMCFDREEVYSYEDASVPQGKYTYQMKTYFLQMIQPDGLGPIKIGRTTNPVEERKRQIDSTGTPYPIRILGWMPGDHEAQLHRQFASLRTRNNREWFLPAPKLVNFIKTHSKTLYT